MFFSNNSAPAWPSIKCYSAMRSQFDAASNSYFYLKKWSESNFLKTCFLNIFWRSCALQFPTSIPILETSWKYIPLLRTVGTFESQK